MAPDNDTERNIKHFNDAIAPVNAVCKRIMALSDSQIDEAEEAIERQASYSHPLRRGTAKRVRTAGGNNLHVIELLRTIRAVMYDAEREQPTSE